MNALRRSLAFWLGTFVLVCLLWLWADSTRYSMSWKSGIGTNPSRIVENRSSCVVLTTSWIKFDAENVIAPASGPSRVRRHLLPLKQFSWFPSPVYDERRGTELLTSYPLQRKHFRVQTRVIPHWLAIACFLPPWLAFVAWRVTRILRAREVFEPSP